MSPQKTLCLCHLNDGVRTLGLSEREPTGGHGQPGGVTFSTNGRVYRPIQRGGIEGVLYFKRGIVGGMSPWNTWKNKLLIRTMKRENDYERFPIPCLYRVEISSRTFPPYCLSVIAMSCTTSTSPIS